MIYIGIRTYDYCHPQPPSNVKTSRDHAGHHLIYQDPAGLIWGYANFNDNKWHKAEADLIPLIHQAAEAAETKGVFKASSLNDLQITSMNFGWEVSGTFDAALRVKNISLEAVMAKGT